jgi:hypothetical protein
MTKKIYDITENRYYRLSKFNLKENYNIEYLEVNETIKELAYLTHDYFRYYGKFPSKVGNYIIEDLSNKNLIKIDEDLIFDNYSGSGTSLVEAKLKKYDSFSIDISPFAVLASRVKTNCLDEGKLHITWQGLLAEITSYRNNYRGETTLSNPHVDQVIVKKIENTLKNIHGEFVDIKKWFRDEAILDLSIIKTLIIEMPLNRYREFLSLAFFSIIRRVSRAHDGEVRPHINKNKKDRDVLEAFKKKVNEMILTMQEWNSIADSSVFSDSFVCSNLDSEKINILMGNIKKKTGKNLGLVISHPPYLNCFDYIPVFKLKFLWAFGFKEIYNEMDYKSIKNSEIRSYPANQDKLVNNYFEYNKEAYKIMYNNLKKGGYCCVVIGDCTVRKELFSVHKTFIKILEEIGFTVDKVVYRSTHYGLGKYAYQHKADYHENENSKKDAIIFFKK